MTVTSTIRLLATTMAAGTCLHAAMYGTSLAETPHPSGHQDYFHHLQSSGLFATSAYRGNEALHFYQQPVHCFLYDKPLRRLRNQNRHSCQRHSPFNTRLIVHSIQSTFCSIIFFWNHWHSCRISLPGRPGNSLYLWDVF